MKIGVTLDLCYLEFLDKISMVNGVSRSGACKLILENFLNFNSKIHRLPYFKVETTVNFKKESSPEEDFEEANLRSTDEPVPSREELLELLNSED